MSANSKLVILGIPLDFNSCYMQGSALAPAKIREAFRCNSTNTWSEQGIDLGKENLFEDAGDMRFSSNEKAFKEIENKIFNLLNQNKKILSFGGDHSITYPIIKSFHKKYKKLNILQFDAHPDLYHELDANPLSHASPFARIMENNLADRLVQIGIRGMNGHQREQADRFGVEVYEMRDWERKIELSFKAPLYISFDLDALDPAFSPGVSHFEPGGLSTRRAINIIQNIKAPEIVGADIVEYNPTRDPSGVTAMVAGKLFKEIASKMLR